MVLATNNIDIICTIYNISNSDVVWINKLFYVGLIRQQDLANIIMGI